MQILHSNHAKVLKIEYLKFVLKNEGKKTCLQSGWNGLRYIFRAMWRGRAVGEERYRPPPPCLWGGHAVICRA